MISHYGVASTPMSAFFIGGFNGDGPIGEINKFSDNTWSRHGDLRMPRFNIQALTYDNETMIFANDGS